MFQGLGMNTDEGLVEGVRARMRQQGSTAEVLDWNPGDVARFEGGRLHLHATPSVSRAA